MITYRSLQNKAAERFEKAGIDAPQHDARQLLLHCFEINTAQLLLRQEEDLEQLWNQEVLSKRLSTLEEMVAAREKRIPLQQILGCAYFMGMPFRVSRHVLTPRQDTEILVERILQERPEIEQSVLDMCTGSGCIAVSLAVLGGYQKITAVDLSQEALAVAEQNADFLLEKDKRSRVQLVQSDLFQNIPKQVETGFGCFDIIVSNPPYICTAEIETLEPEVRLFEPRMALDGSRDGLLFYRRIAAEAPEWLKAGGSLYLEIGWDQGAAVQEMLQDRGFEQVCVLKDLAGHDRVVRADWPGMSFEKA